MNEIGWNRRLNGLLGDECFCIVATLYHDLNTKEQYFWEFGFEIVTLIYNTTRGGEEAESKTDSRLIEVNEGSMWARVEFTSLSNCTCTPRQVKKGGKKNKIRKGTE